MLVPQAWLLMEDKVWQQYCDKTEKKLGAATGHSASLVLYTLRGEYLLQLGVLLPQLAFSPPLAAASFFLPFSASVPITIFAMNNFVA